MSLEYNNGAAHHQGAATLNTFFWPSPSQAGRDGGINMAAVRDFLVAFGIVTGVLMSLVSFMFLGSTFMNEFVSMADMGKALVASAILSVLLAVPLATVGTTSRKFDFIGEKN